MNEQKSIYAAYQEIKQREIKELKKKLRAFGGVAHFGPDYTGEGATGVDMPFVCVHSDVGPYDVKIHAVELDSDDHLVILGDENEHEEYPHDIYIDDIAYGHIEFITDAIPQAEEKPLPYFTDIRGNLSDGSWVSIDCDNHSWEYQSDADDDDTYISGNYDIDDVCNDSVVGYDGCYELPAGVKAALKAVGYTLDLD